VYRTTLICLLAVLEAGSTPAPRHQGVTSLLTQDVSIQELLGHPESMDGQNVRVILAAFFRGSDGSIDTSHATDSRVTPSAF
jgi:hypothetical protein